VYYSKANKGENVAYTHGSKGAETEPGKANRFDWERKCCSTTFYIVLRKGKRLRSTTTWAMHEKFKRKGAQHAANQLKFRIKQNTNINMGKPKQHFLHLY
jgi:hypothetical protein